MTIHTRHPDTHDNGLADDCPRCAEHAEAPWRGLDQENLSRIIRCAVGDRSEALTYTDQLAAVAVLNTLERAGHMYRTAPDLVGEFFSRYGIRVEA